MAIQQELALQMIAQLRLLDPSISAEIGTPERKIIDTVAQALYENQIDLDSLSAGLDIDSKYGAQLDRFLSIFGFARQKATFATGFVTFSRTTPANVDIRISANARVQAPADPTVTEGDAGDVLFYTLFDATLPAGSTSIIVPVRAIIPGASGNVAAERITEITGQTIYGITAVTNETPTSGGRDAESDEEFKVRFKNTVFRNLAGTQDQYMALAIATAYTTKANVVGPQSLYREYVQVPSVDDNSNWDVQNDSNAEWGNGNANEFTTALSTIPYAKYTYATEFPVFVSNGQAGIGQVFYRQSADFVFNSPPINAGDAYRFFNTSGTKLDIDASSTAAKYRPNVTFKNVYTGVNGDVTAIRPGDVVLLEYSYMSEASRNDIAKGIANAVDVFIDGGNIVQASTVTIRPTTATAFVDDPNSKFHYENYRRVGEPEKRPLIGNVLMQMFWQPTTDVPDQIIVGTVTYLKGVHYWAVEDVSSLAGTVRARCGIEWSTKVFGKAQVDAGEDPSTYTGKTITDASGDPAGGQPVEITGYFYDRNIVELQAALEGAKQVTSDVLAHKSKKRYFKLDVTVMYSPGASVTDTNQRIREAVDTFLQGQYFGSAIQLSDLLQVIHGVSGVDNVRWTNETNTNVTTRIYETDAHGVPLLTMTADRIQPGTGSRPDIQGLYLTGQPTGGGVAFTWGGNTSSVVTNITAANLQSAIGAISGIGTLTVTEDTRTTTGVRYPIRSFRITWGSNGAKALVVPSNTLTGGPYVIRSDFFLRDDELAMLATEAQALDTVPGMIIRPRAQNTWVKVN